MKNSEIINLIYKSDLNSTFSTFEKIMKKKITDYKPMVFVEMLQIYEDLYNLKISSIEEQAAIYAEAHTDMFAESNDVYMTVEELALNNAIISTSEGVVADPRDNDETLNELRVKITNNEDEITAEVLV